MPGRGRFFKPVLYMGNINADTADNSAHWMRRLSNLL
jgi:hypothetical protein